MEKKYLAPLHFCYPNQELAELFLEHGADGSLMNIALSYTTYKENLEYLDFVLANFFMKMIEKDEKGKTAL